MKFRGLLLTKNIFKFLIILVVLINLTSITYIKIDSYSQPFRELIHNDEQAIQSIITTFHNAAAAAGTSDHITFLSPASTAPFTTKAKHDASAPAVSVIIPVYMVEKYIEKCVASLLSQTLGDALEFIFVDDLGKDGSIGIVAKYAAIDPRIRIIRNPAHLGTGASRNAGIAAARGEFLGFVDPDDWVSPTFYESLYNVARTGSFDVVKGRMVELTESSRYKSSKLNEKIVKKIGKMKTKNETINIFELFTHQHQTGLFKKSVVEASGKLVRYGESYSAQDITFLLTYGFFAKSLACVDDARYYYLVRHDSVSNNFSYDFLKGDFESMNERFNFIEDRGLTISDFPEYKKRCITMAKRRYKQLMALKKYVENDEFELLKTYALNTMDRLK